jgi:hypothetical protein
MPSYGGNYTGLGLDMAVGSHLRHYKQLQQRMDARNTKAESITLRKDWLQAQKRANYQGEYDRIRGLLSQTILPAGAKRLEDREKELKGLGITGPSIMV